MSASLVLRSPAAVDEHRSSRPQRTLMSVSEVPLYELVPVFGWNSKTRDRAKWPSGYGGGTW